MNCKICGRDPGNRVIEYIEIKTGNVAYVECEPCNLKARIDNFNKTGIITTSLWTKAMLANLDHRRNEELLPISEAMDSLKPLVKEFESKVWFNGLQKIVREAKFAGLSGKTSYGPILIFTSAGRAMITLSGKAEDSITLITIEDESKSCMGIQGIDSTILYATQYIKLAISDWLANKLTFTSDREVRIAGT